MHVSKLLENARKALDALDALAADSGRLAARAPGLSAWSAAQHAVHLAEANVLCLRAAETLVDGSDTRIEPTGSPNLMGRMVLTLGRIPRGKGRAPEQTRPPDDPDPASLAERLRPGREVLERLAASPEAVERAPGRLPHPVLGSFSAAQWLRFTDVHVRHHLAIVADIERHPRTR